MKVYVDTSVFGGVFEEEFSENSKKIFSRLKRMFLLTGIVNVECINGYNSVNLKHGYKILDIRTPKEALHYEEY